jgi:hypothetical protein
VTKSDVALLPSEAGVVIDGERYDLLRVVGGASDRAIAVPAGELVWLSDGTDYEIKEWHRANYVDGRWQLCPEVR